MTEEHADNVVSISEAPGAGSPLALIVRRRKAIHERKEALREQFGIMHAEFQALVDEDDGLRKAEEAVRKLLKRGDTRGNDDGP